jgi:hypothetical protein
MLLLYPTRQRVYRVRPGNDSVFAGNILSYLKVYTVVVMGLTQIAQRYRDRDQQL